MPTRGGFNLYASVLRRSVDAMKFTEVSRAMACSFVSIPGVARMIIVPGGEWFSFNRYGFWPPKNPGLFFHQTIQRFHRSVALVFQEVCLGRATLGSFNHP